MLQHDEKKLNLYKGSVVWFCCYLSQFIKLSRQLKAGLHVSKRKIIYASSMAEQYKTKLIEDKAAMGFGGGLNFIKDHHFKDFSIINHEIVGDKSKVLPTVSNNIDYFPDHVSNYDYEVGIYALALGWSDGKKGLYPPDLEKRPQKEHPDMPQEEARFINNAIYDPEKIIDKLVFCPVTCFDSCKNIQELKNMYRSLCKTYHPDSADGYGKLFCQITDEYNKRLQMMN